MSGNVHVRHVASLMRRSVGGLLDRDRDVEADQHREATITVEIHGQESRLAGSGQGFQASLDQVGSVPVDSDAVRPVDEINRHLRTVVTRDGAVEAHVSLLIDDGRLHRTETFAIAVPFLPAGLDEASA